MDVVVQNGHKTGQHSSLCKPSSDVGELSNGHNGDNAKEESLVNGLDSLFTDSNRRHMTKSPNAVTSNGNPSDSADAPIPDQSESSPADCDATENEASTEVTQSQAASPDEPQSNLNPDSADSSCDIETKPKAQLDDSGKTECSRAVVKSDTISTGCENLDLLLSTKEKREEFVQQLINDLLSEKSETVKSVGVADAMSDNLKAFVITVAGGQAPLDGVVTKLRTVLGIPDQIVIPPSEVVPMMAVTNHQGTDRSVDKPVSDNANSPCFPCPAMTSVLMEIGLNLVMESQSVVMYEKMSKDIHTNSHKLKDVSKRLDDLHMGAVVPDSDSEGEDNIDNTKKTKTSLEKSVSTLTQNKQKLKTEIIRLKDENRPFRLKMSKCQKCDFRTESLAIMYHHMLYPHRKLNRLECGFCEFRVATFEDISAHYQDEHGAPAYEYLYPAKFACEFCQQDDFTSKGALKLHIRSCANNNPRNMNLAPVEDDLLHINRLFWGLNDSQLRRIQQRMFAARRQHQLNQSKVDPQAGRRPLVGARSGVSGAAGLLNNRPADALRNASFQNILPKPGLAAAAAAAAAQSRVPQGQPPIGRATMDPRAAAAAAVMAQQSIQYMQYKGRGRPPKMVTDLARRPMGRPPMLPQPAATNKLFHCEICDNIQQGFIQYSLHLQHVHGKHLSQDVNAPPPLSCSKCVNQRFYSYEGLERHLLAVHNLVSQELLRKAREKKDGGRCKLCTKHFAAGLVQHCATVHKMPLCTADIVYTCDICKAKFTVYQQLEHHLAHVHKRTTRPQAQSYSQIMAAQRQSQQGGSPQRGRPPKFQPSSLPGPGPSGAAGGGLLQQQQRPGVPAAAPRIRYNCTPCQLKFATYAEVIEHWRTSHLKRFTVPLCQIDACAPCGLKRKIELVESDGEEELEDGENGATVGEGGAADGQPGEKRPRFGQTYRVSAKTEKPKGKDDVIVLD